MAEEFTRLVKIGIDESFIKASIANADRLAKSIDELKQTKKEEGQLSAEQEGRLKALTAERNKNIQVVKQANLLTSETIKGQEKLKAQLSVLTAQFNKLTTEEQNNTKEGQRLQKQILDITNTLKANEKAVGNNRRNVGNYEEALKGVADQINVMGVNLGGLITQLKTQSKSVKAVGAAMKASAASTGGLSGALQILKVALISTGIGAIVVALGSMVTFLTQTKRGSELLAQGMAAVGATISVVVDRISGIGEAVTNVFTGNGSILDVLGVTKEAFSGVTDEIQREVKASTELEKRMQKLRDAERDLIVSTAERNAEVAKLRVTIEDQSKSEEERLKAAQRATALQRQTIEEEKALAQERVDIIQAQLALSENLEEDEQRLADAKAERFRIEEQATQRLVELNNKEVGLRKQIAKGKEDAVKKMTELSKQEKEAAENAAKESEKALEEGFKKERDLIDQKAELQKAQAEIEIVNAEERAARIAFIEREALFEKLRSIEDETAAYTASADMVGAVDEEKYAKQLAERAKYEAQLAAIDREAKADEFNREMELLQGREELANQQAEIEIENVEERELAKQKISLKYLNERLAIMEQSAMLDDVLTDREIQNLQRVRNEIEILQNQINNPDNKTVADMIGLSEEGKEKLMLGMEVVSSVLQSVQQATQQATENKLAGIDQELQAEINAINSSEKSQEDKEKAITKAEQKAAKERYRIELQQFKTAKALQIALAVANTATAVMAQLSNPTPYAGFVLAALAAATGAVQIATISSQKPPPPPSFAKGGLLQGNTHANGGIPIKMKGGGMIEAEDKEIILTKGVYENPALRNEASRLNVMAGGVPIPNTTFSSGGLVRKFAAGGVATSSGLIMRENEAQMELQNTILQNPPVLVLEEFQNVQGRKVRTEQNLQI